MVEHVPNKNINDKRGVYTQVLIKYIKKLLGNEKIDGQKQFYSYTTK